AMDGVPVDPQWWASFCEAAVPELPDEPTDEQLAAWLELAELVADESFLPEICEKSRPFWEAAQGHFDFGAWRQTMGELTEAAAAEARAGGPPVGKRANRLIDRWLAMQAATVGQKADEAFAVELLKRVEEAPDPRARRYWELVGLLRGCSSE